MALTLLFSTAISIWLSEVTTLNIPTIGTIKTIGVEAYWDQNLDNKTETIDWDTIWLGSSKNVTLYLQSTSSVKTIVQLNATNFNPKNISKYIHLSWNYYGTPINPNEVTQVTITLSTIYSKSLIGSLIANESEEFSFEIIISAIE